MSIKLSADSHLDHVPSSVLEWVLKTFASRDSFFIEECELPPELPTLECGLHGPACGDAPVPEAEVRYASRNGRSTKSRLCARPTRQTRRVVVICGPDDEPVKGEIVIYTVYGGPQAPREPDDPGIAGKSELISEAKAFWSEHALSG